MKNLKKLKIIENVKPWFYEQMKACKLCPRACGINRLNGEKGYCNLDGELMPISSICLHHGEEPPISGTKGSATVFFSNCNLQCVFCQNYQISTNNSDKDSTLYSYEDLAKKMLEFQEAGAHNINLVSPTSHISNIIFALEYGYKLGLNIPIFYNTNSYDSYDVIKNLNGIIDIYLPDAKYSDSRLSNKYSDAFDYTDNMKLVLKEMYRQTRGVLELDEKDIAIKGLIIRHLILPANVENSKYILKFIADELNTDVHLALMSQYNPTQNAKNFGNPLNRSISEDEYYKVKDYALSLGFHNGWFQDLESVNIYNPDFNKIEKPFL